MVPAAVLEPPYLTAEMPGIGGLIKVEPEDFAVEEIPLYPASGVGEHLYVWIEKRGMGAEYFQRQISRRLGISVGEIGMAGLKDRHAVTRQWISIPVHVESELSRLDGDGIKVLEVTRHTNKLKPGHLAGNRFRILIRGVDTAAERPARAIVDAIARLGLPNFYGSQRLGREAQTASLGLKLLAGEQTQDRAVKRNPFLRKLALSAAQAAIYNLYLAQRMQDGLLHQVLPGDVMSKSSGGLFFVTDVAREQSRFLARETTHAGPICGRKTFAAQADAAERETAMLASFGLDWQSFSGFGNLLQGTRRENLVYPGELALTMQANGLQICFLLPSGSYATVMLRELMKSPLHATDEAGMTE